MFGAPTDWAFDASYMLYGTLFMMAGAYALSRNGHVRGDFIYRAWPPRRQAGMDLVLYILFFFPGMLAFIYSGYGFAELSRRMNEHSSASPNGPIVWPFKWMITIVGVLDGAAGHRRGDPLHHDAFGPANGRSACTTSRSWKRSCWQKPSRKSRPKLSKAEETGLRKGDI